MNGRALFLVSRAIRASPQSLVLRTPMQRRFASSEQQPSNLAQFYKTFTRPVAKVLLLAFFTYQLAYWAWVKLEQDEIMAKREAYIAELEDEIDFLNKLGPEDVKERNSHPHHDDIRYYQIQLMKLEQRNKEVLAAMKQAENEGIKDRETTGQKKTSSWWKVW